MADINSLDSAAMFEALSAYQVAVMAFTTPAEVVFEGGQPSVVLTSKDSYVWAGAVAYVLVRRPEIEGDPLYVQSEGASDCQNHQGQGG